VIPAAWLTLTALMLAAFAGAWAIATAGRATKDGCTGFSTAGGESL
jgi:hypothetical protein